MGVIADEPNRATCRVLAEASDDAVVVTDARADDRGPRIVHANAAFERLTGPCGPALAGEPVSRIVELVARGRGLAKLRRALARGEPFTGTYIVRSHTPAARWSIRAVGDSDGRLSGLVAWGQPDGRADGERPDHDGTHRQIFEQHSIPMLLIDPSDGAIVDANPSALSFYGYSYDALRGREIQDINTLSREGVAAEMGRAQRENANHFVFRHRLANGEVRPVEVHSSPIRIGGHEYLHSIVHDISDRDRLRQAIDRARRYDDATGLPNHTLLREHMGAVLDQRATHERRQAALCHIDLDRSRELTRLRGPSATEAVLTESTERAQMLLGTGPLIARIGADQLAVFLPEAADRGRLEACVEQLCRALSQPVAIGVGPVHPTVSIGVAVFPEHGEDGAALLESAETAVAQVKQRGGDGWACYSPQSVTRAREMAVLADALRGSIEAGMLDLALQPTFDLRSGEVEGAEALARWYHDAYGWVSPERFIPVAERTEQIEALGAWVLRRVARHLGDSADIDAPRHIAVNVSIRQLNSARFVADVERVLQETGIRPERLELELTEGVFADNESNDVMERLERLRGLGLPIAIDDFGTGFSSLQYLRRLPVDRVKIDRGFVRGLDVDTRNRAIVAAILDLAAQFDLAVTAEGIETAAEARTLLDLGCVCGQGFYFARPNLLDRPTA